MPHWQAYNLLREKGFEVGLSEREDQVPGSLDMLRFGPRLKERRTMVDKLVARVKEQVKLQKRNQRKRAQVRGLQPVLL